MSTDDQNGQWLEQSLEGLLLDHLYAGSRGDRCHWGGLGRGEVRRGEHLEDPVQLLFANQYGCIFIIYGRYGHNGMFN